MRASEILRERLAGDLANRSAKLVRKIKKAPGNL
jgi:hypothetical protein